MKREIKFRVWDIEARRMFWFDLLWGNHNTGNGYVGVAPWGEPQSKRLHRDNMWLVDPTECEIMQFTGLKDKNGKEIYEGDMVRWEDIQDDGYGCGYLTTIEEPVYFGGGAFYPICTMPEKQFEVIGNIYENSDLLK